TIAIVFVNLQKLFVVGDCVRARTHDRHLTTQNVDELWQLIDAVSPQQRADAGYAIVGFFGLQHLFAVIAGGHCTKFVDEKSLAAKPTASLQEQHRPGTLKRDCDGACQKERRKHDQRKASKPEIKAAFQNSPNRG